MKYYELMPGELMKTDGGCYEPIVIDVLNPKPDPGPIMGPAPGPWTPGPCIFGGAFSGGC